MEAFDQSVGGVTAPTSAHSVGELPQPLVVRDGAITVRELVSSYMAAYTGRDLSRVQRLSYWVATLGDVPIRDLDDDRVFAAIDDLAQRRGRYFGGRDADGRPILRAKRGKLSAATLNRYQAALSAVLTWAQRRRIAPRGWVNPCQTLPMREERNEIVRYLSGEERAALLSACKDSKWPKLYLLVLMALTTGARRGELEAMRWGDVDLERGEASVARSKNGDRKTLVLVPAVVAELRRHAGAPTALIFRSSRRPDAAFNFEPHWDRALKVAGVKTFRFHDLRHSCASALAQNGATLLEIADVLGHRQLSVTRRYSHLATDQKAKLIHRVLGKVS